MKVELKTWTRLGVATALAGAGLAGCADDPAEDNADPAVATQTGEMGGGEGGEGEGGEGGEGGVSIDAAGSDPIVYNSALAVAEAHAIAARDAYAAGRTDAAAEMFAHPVSEVLADMDPVFEAQGVADFKPLFQQASTAVFEGQGEAQVEQRFDAIIAALRDAAQRAPDNGTGSTAIGAGVAAEMIDRAAAMYREAGSSDRYEPYLDGYGYYRAAQSAFEPVAGDLEGENARLHSAIEQALAILGRAYSGADRPDRLPVEEGEVLSAASQVMLRR
ncbi:MAG: hypothetical protein WA985_08355 [Erythrobacter sp.]